LKIQKILKNNKFIQINYDKIKLNNIIKKVEKKSMFIYLGQFKMNIFIIKNIFLKIENKSYPE
jgi:hypothetical protein